MNRWGVRIVGVLLIVMFALVFLQMYKSLVTLQRQRESAVGSRP